MIFLHAFALYIIHFFVHLHSLKPIIIFFKEEAKQNFLVRAFIFVLLLCLTGQNIAMGNNTKTEVLRSLISKNQRYSKDAPADSIIIWGEQLEPILLQNKRYQDFFDIKYLIVHTNAMRGDISLAIDKVHLMSEEARALNYDLGFALSSQAIGDTYIYSNMLHEAFSSYKQALDIFNNIGDADIYKKRLLSRITQVTLLKGNPEEALHYLNQLNQLVAEDDIEDPLHIHRLTLNASYYLTLGLLEEAKKHLDKANEHAEKCDAQLAILTYANALYFEKTGDHNAALTVYECLLKTLVGDLSAIGQNQIILSYANLLLKAGKDDEACQLYLRVNERKDSLSIKSYARQIDRLHADYQINAMELENQAEKGDLARMAIIVGGCTLFLSFLLASYIRKSNQKLAESKQHLENAKKQAEASIRSKSMFLSNMSHEIRTPLNALSGFSAILTEDSIDHETRLQCTEIIQQNSELLLKLINDVIDLSSLEFGKMQFHFKDSDAITICRNVVEMVQKIKQTKAEILFDTPLEELILHTDDARLQQVLINLLINATKFTPSGSITLGLSMQSEDVALFTVTDTGCGIPLENQKKIFKRFEKLDEQDQGTGLGLSICQLIIKHIGGDIWIDPEYTEGSRFCFTHPIRNRRNA